MSEPKFTPGPWMAVQHGEGIYTWTIMGNDEYKDRSLAIVGVGTPNLKRDEANMRLIAAAPELYDALEEMVDDYCKSCMYIRPRGTLDCKYNESCFARKYLELLKKVRDGE